MNYLDVDFTTDPNYAAGFNGYGDTERFAAYGDDNPTYPKEKWNEIAQANKFGCDDLVTRIYNQKQEGSCVANATSQAVEIIQAKQFGKDRVVHLSAISLYKRIGRSASSGAVVSDAWDEINAKGQLPLNDDANLARFKHTMPNTGFSTPYPSGWEETGRLFKGLEAFSINSMEDGVSALLNGHPVVVGRSGHSICYVRFMLKDGKRVVKYANSWGDWGDAGYGYDSEGMMSSAFRGAFALRAITFPTFQK